MKRASPHLTIGRLARSGGVNIETIRFCQRKVLLPKPYRPAGGIRRYDPSILARLRFILSAQHLGFRLAEVGRIAIRLGLARTTLRSSRDRECHRHARPCRR